MSRLDWRFILRVGDILQTCQASGRQRQASGRVELLTPDAWLTAWRDVQVVGPSCRARGKTWAAEACEANTWRLRAVWRLTASSDHVRGGWKEELTRGAGVGDTGARHVAGSGIGLGFGPTVVGFFWALLLGFYFGHFPLKITLSLLFLQ